MKIRILGIPLDLGQERRGVDMGPSAVRAAGLNSALKGLGHHVEDAGNIHVRIAEEQPFGDKRAKYMNEIAATCREAAERVYQTLEGRRVPDFAGRRPFDCHGHAGGRFQALSRTEPVNRLHLD